MLNSILTGPLDQLLKRRDSYLAALRRHGRPEAEIAGLMKNWGVSRQIYVAESDAQALAEAKDAEMWYQDSLRRFQVPERIEDAHPSLQPGFRAAAERFAKVTWERPRGGDGGLRIARHGGQATSRTCATWASARCCAG